MLMKLTKWIFYHIMTFEEIYLYRITHIENVPHILQYGITHRKSPCANPDFKAIGDSSLISFRESTILSCGGKSVALGEYIPFYFGVRMPMLYVIQHGGNFVPSSVKPDDIIYLVVNMKEVIGRIGDFCYFCDGHATDSFTHIYGPENFYMIPDLVNWTAVKALKWSGENVERDLKRKKQAEFLVGQDIPKECLYGYVCYSEKSKAKLVSYGIPDEKVKVFPKAYY